MAAGENNQISCFFNVGGCLFSIPLSRLSLFQDSLLYKEALGLGKLASSCTTEVNILYEQAAGLHLTSLQQALENLQSGKHFLRARPEDLQVTERASLNYWKTRICNPKLPEPMTSPVSTVHNAIPPGLVGAPLVDSDEEVHYCFLPLELVRRHPSLVTQDNLLWLCEDVVVIECSSLFFRFIANFLHTGKILLPEQFYDYETLNCEAEIGGIPDFTKALQDLQDTAVNDRDDLSIQDWCPQSKMQSSAPPLYVMTFDLLVKYPDSSLGQLYVDCNLEGSKLHITGSGVIFQHVENWLGICCLPLTETASQLYGLCEYLDGQDELYLAIKEAMWEFFNRRTTGKPFTAGPLSASVSKYSVYKVIKVYVGTHWYATYFKTLLKYPELLSNSRKVRWIAFGQSLYVKGDGAMFRHILNFLRCGRLMLPSEFSEWPLLLHEIEEFKIPALSDALKEFSDYRAWRKSKEFLTHTSTSSDMPLLINDDDEDNSVDITYEEDSEEEPQCDAVASGRGDCSSSSPGTCESQSPAPACTLNDATESRGESLGIKDPRAEGASEPSAQQERLGQAPQGPAWTQRNMGVNGEPKGQPNSRPMMGQPSAWTDIFPEQDLDQLGADLAPPSEYTLNGEARDSPRTPELQQSQCQVKDKNSERKPPAGGSVLRVLHPAFLGKGETSRCFTESIIYKATPPHAVPPPQKKEDPHDVAFVCFNMAYEDMLHARECHAFITGIILDSQRLEEPKDCTLEKAGLVYLLWTGQAKPEDFVRELVKISCFENQKYTQEELLQWLKYTLRFAKQYSECIELLGTEHCHAVTLFPED